MFNFLKKRRHPKKPDKLERVIRFKDRHYLGLECYNASDLYLQYGNLAIGQYTRERNDGERKIAGPKPEGYQPSADMGSYKVFESKVKLRWRDKADNPISYVFDFEDIFKDKIIPHVKEDEDRILWEAEYPYIYPPGIIIEVDDRTLNIYSDLDVALKIPGTDEVEQRRDLIKVFSKTF